MHKPDARVYADTKSWLVPNYFVVGIFPASIPLLSIRKLAELGQIYSERRGLGVRHKPDARVYADTKSCLVTNYFVVGMYLVSSFSKAKI